jgi:hypothetical protein
MKKGLKQKENSKKLLWILDGFVGILALIIYNFLLYLLNSINTGEIISKMQDTMGYFGINSFSDFGFTTTQITIGLLWVFLLSFLLGILIGKLVRKRKHKII